MEKSLPEQFDRLDCAGRKTGAVILRDEAHRTGAWHGAFHCLILSERDGRACALFQKRSLRKQIAPGKFDVSVGGHYSAGEDAETAGPREIREELGLTVRFAELLPLGRRIFVYCFAPGIVECEFQDVFFLPKTVGPRDLVLSPEEVDGVLELDGERGIELFAGRVQSAEGLLTTAEKTSEVAVTVRDFVPCLDQYYLKLLILARRYWSGDRDLLVI